jgi:undecaprenyl-diphosphatase
MKFLKIKLDLFDQKIINWIATHRNQLVDKFLAYLTHTGSGKAWLIFSLSVCALNFSGIHFTQYQGAFMLSMFAPLMAWSIGLVLKKLISKKRPENAYNLIKTPLCGSFPSNHTSASVAFFIALILRNHPLSIYVGVWALLISFSRMYLSVHYFTDVLGGVLVAISSACILYLIF